MITMVSLAALGYASQLKSTVGDEDEIVVEIVQKEFKELGETQPRWTEASGRIVNQNEWDRSILIPSGLNLNEACVKVADTWTLLCNNRLEIVGGDYDSFPPPYFIDTRVSGSCDNDDYYKQINCERVECAIEKCFEERDNYIDKCAENSRIVLDELWNEGP